MKLGAVFSILMIMGSAAPAAAADVFGRWLTENRKAIVAVEPCGEKACGRIVWMQEPLAADGTQKLDKNNPDAALRTRTICGLPLVGDFSRTGDGEWGGGFIYDPEGGDTYKSSMRLTSEGNLYVRGYIGISLFGKSQIWTPAPEGQTGC